jgi:hypothetical protein
MLRFVMGALLIGHGLVHLAWFAPVPADDTFPFRWESPIFPRIGPAALKKAVTPAIIVMVALLALGALGVWGVPALAGIWQAAAIMGAIISFAVMALLWHPWFVTGPLVNFLIVAFALYPGLFS